MKHSFQRVLSFLATLCVLISIVPTAGLSSLGALAEVDDVVAYVDDDTAQTEGELGNVDKPYKTINEAIAALEASTASGNRVIEVIGSYSVVDKVGGYYAFATHSKLITIKGYQSGATLDVPDTFVSIGGPLKIDKIALNIPNNKRFHANGYPLEIGDGSNTNGRLASGSYATVLRNNATNSIVLNGGKFHSLMMGDLNATQPIPGFNFVMNGGTLNYLFLGTDNSNKQATFTKNINIELNDGTFNNGFYNQYFNLASGVAMQIIANNGVNFSFANETIPRVTKDADGKDALYILKAAKGGSTLHATDKTGVYTIKDPSYSATATDGTNTYTSKDGMLTIPKAGEYTITWSLDDPIVTEISAPANITSGTYTWAPSIYNFYYNGISPETAYTVSFDYYLPRDAATLKVSSDAGYEKPVSGSNKPELVRGLHSFSWTTYVDPSGRADGRFVPFLTADYATELYVWNWRITQNGAELSGTSQNYPPSTYGTSNKRLSEYAWYDSLDGVISQGVANGQGLINSINKANGVVNGTLANTTVDNLSVKEIHTADTAVDVLSAQMEVLQNKFSDDGAIGRASALKITYKYVPAENSSTDLAALLQQHPQMELYSPSTITGKINATETVVANEWATATFSFSSLITDASEYTLSKALFRPFGIRGSGAATDTQLKPYGANAKAIHVDPADTLYIASAELVYGSYIVSFDANGGEGVFESITTGRTGTITPPATNPTKSGCRFAGWGTSPSTTICVNLSNYVPTQNTTLYAVYTERLITTSKLDGSGKVAAMSSADGIKSGFFENVTYEGYNAVRLSVNANSQTMLSADVRPLGEWVCRTTRIVVTYKYVPAANTTTDLAALQADKPTALILNPFGFYLDAAENIKVGEWTTATFDFSSKIIGGTNGFPADNYNREEILKQLHLMMAGTNARGTALTGQAQFPSSGSLVIDPNDSVYIGEIAFQYKYDYEVSFDANGGGGAPQSEYLAAGYGAKFNGTAPIRIGYQFKGWSLTNTNNVNTILPAGYVPSADTTLYAVWQEDDAFALSDFAILEPNKTAEEIGIGHTIGQRNIVQSGNKLFADSAETFADNLPSYLVGMTYLYADKVDKALYVAEKGRSYVLAPTSERDTYVERGYVVIGALAAGQLSSGIQTDYDILSRACANEEVIPLTANAIVVGDICYPDDALIAGNVIVNPADQLDSHPEYAAYLDGNRAGLTGGCPSITKTPSGTVFMSITAGSITDAALGPVHAGEDMYSYSLLYRSNDNGETYGQPILVVDPDTPVRTSEPLVWCDPDGKLWFFWSQMYTPNCRDRNSDGRMGIWYMTSDNDGASWSEPTRIADGFTNQNPVVLKDGTWVLPANVWKSSQDYAQQYEYLMHPHVYLSTDKGATWELGGICSTHSSSAHVENALVEKADGTLWMLLRTNRGLEETFSDDGGKTWTPAVYADISKTESRPGMDKLPNGDIVVVSHDDAEANGSRYHLTVWLSEDDGKTFPYKLKLEASASFYPNTHVDSDGTIYIVYDVVREDGGQVMMARITADDIKAGKLVNPDSALKLLINKGKCATLDKATLTFDVDGGKAIDDMLFTTTYASCGTANPVPYAVRVLPAAFKGGYVFEGWATEADGDVVYTAGANYTPTSMNTTLYAVYSKDATVAKMHGAQARDSQTNDMRFIATASVSGVSFREDGSADYSTATFVVGDQTVCVVDVGMLVSLNHSSADDMAFAADGSTLSGVKTVSAQRLQNAEYAILTGMREEGEEFILFTAVVRNIPDAYIEQNITARAYVAYIDANGQTAYLYSDCITRTYDMIAPKE